MSKRIIVTADDLGIDKKVNNGIIESYKNGILTSTALLMNAPETNEGIKLAQENPGLEVGIHLSIVEGISLRNIESSVTDKIRYFDDHICLIRNWKDFIIKYVLRKINFTDLEEELDLQIETFLKHFPIIPFINGTQHMHLMPKVWDIVFKLAKKYHIKAIRIPGISKPSVLWLNKRLPFLIPFQLLGERAKRDCLQSGIDYPGDILGMQYSGKIDEKRLLFLLSHINGKTTELVMHPGYESKKLRSDLPWAYGTFDWDCERKALQSKEVKDFITKNQIELIKFSELKKVN